MMRFLIFFIAFSVKTIVANTEECYEELEEWIKTLILPVSKANERYSKMVRYSGKSLNDLGLYYDCIELPNANYVIFEINEYPALVIGLCLPEICTENDF